MFGVFCMMYLKKHQVLVVNHIGFRVPSKKKSSFHPHPSISRLSWCAGEKKIVALFSFLIFSTRVWKMTYLPPIRDIIFIRFQCNYNFELSRHLACNLPCVIVQSRCSNSIVQLISFLQNGETPHTSHRNGPNIHIYWSQQRISDRYDLFGLFILYHVSQARQRRSYTTWDAVAMRHTIFNINICVRDTKINKSPMSFIFLLYFVHIQINK